MCVTGRSKEQFPATQLGWTRAYLWRAFLVVNPPSAERPVVASYCATFLKPEMLHIYRQISRLQRVRPVVITQKREHGVQFPFKPVYVIPRPATRLLRRLWFRQLLHRPWQISRMELETFTRVLEQSDASLLHIYFGHIAVHLLPLIRSWPKPTIVSFHGADVLVELDQTAYRRATEEMLSAVTRIFVRSESLGRAVCHLNVDAQKICIVRTGIPIDDFPFRRRQQPEGGAWRLVQAGRLIEKKGIATSLRAFREFSRLFPAARLTVAGEGPLLDELKSLTTQLGIQNKVSFPGFLAQESLRDLLYASHIFLHPSQLGSDGNQEGVPNAMLEAMATGLPVFATRHGGIPEAIDDGTSGILVEEGDYWGLARELTEAVKDGHRLTTIGEAAAKSVVEKFDQRKQIERLEQLYIETITAK